MANNQVVFEERTALQAVVETTPGTEATPTAATDNILVSNLDGGGLLSVNEIERNYYKGAFGSVKTLQDLNASTVSFDVEISAVNDATIDQTPFYDALFLGCGLAKTVIPGSSAINRATEYKPNTNSSTALTLWISRGDYVSKMVGARGTFTFALTPDENPVFRFTFTGEFKDKAALTLPTAGLNRFKDPLPVNPTNTSVSGMLTAMRSAEFDMGNTVQFLKYAAGKNCALITDRAATLNFVRDFPQTGGSYDLVNTQNVNRSAQITHGQNNGNKIEFVFPQIQVTSVPESIEEERIVETINCRVLTDLNTPDSDFTIRYVGDTTS